MAWIQYRRSDIIVCLIAVLTPLVIESLHRGHVSLGLMWAKDHASAFFISSVLVSLCVLTLWVILPIYVSLSVCGFAFLILAFASREKMETLGEPVYMSDLLLVRQLPDVANMLGSRGLLLGILAMAALLGVIALIYCMKSRRTSLSLRLLVSMASMLAIADFTVDQDFSHASVRTDSQLANQIFEGFGVENHSWNPRANLKSNGILLSFFFSIPSALVYEPDDYDEKAIAGIVTKYANRSGIEVVDGGEKAINIIAILSESYWDPTLLPKLSWSNDPARLLHAGTTQNFVRGMALSPVFGGYTCNAEFEFLTGLSMAFLPRGSIPYQHHLHANIPSLASFFRHRGYKTTAIHPNDARFWNREQVFRHMGFDRFISIADFRHPEMAGPYVTDMALTEKILETLKNNEGSSFIFAASIGNHMPYDFDRFSRVSDFYVTSRQDIGFLPGQLDLIRNYAKGVSEAEKALYQLIDALSKPDQPETIVLLFGDHLPPFGHGFSAYHAGGLVGDENPVHWSLAEHDLMHTVPYLVWSNRALRAQPPKDLINFSTLHAYLVKLVGSGQSGFHRLLDDVATGGLVRGYAAAPTPSGRMRTNAHAAYELIQYAVLHGQTASVKEIFQ
jgi:phosphoglycerol transferase MdoB-like AlkP superfamily enzyme